LLQDVTNLLALLSAAAEMRSGPRALIRAGSLAEYGNGAVPSDESQREEPLTTYTTAMVAGLHYSRMLQPKLPFPVVTARFALVYGPRQSDDYFLPWLMHRCRMGQRSEVSRPECRRDMIYIADVVAGLRAMAATELTGGTVLNLSTGVAPTVREIASLIVEACGADPSLVSFREDRTPNLRVHALHGSPRRAEELLGWRAQTSLAEGLQLCLADACERLSA
jgi:nucleoside-diphosphate-sugar epimerase